MLEPTLSTDGGEEMSRRALVVKCWGITMINQERVWGRNARTLRTETLVCIWALALGEFFTLSVPVSHLQNKHCNNTTFGVIINKK